VRGLNHHALPFLVGTKFDSFYALDKAEQAAAGLRVDGSGRLRRPQPLVLG
jgi:hypothetical protein